LGRSAIYSPTDDGSKWAFDVCYLFSTSGLYKSSMDSSLLESVVMVTKDTLSYETGLKQDHNGRILDDEDLGRDGT